MAHCRYNLVQCLLLLKQMLLILLLQPILMSVLLLLMTLVVDQDVIFVATFMFAMLLLYGGLPKNLFSLDPKKAPR